ncbi:sodium:solute symporter family transporter [Fulvivirga sedimenti]|uniref:Sodium/solute symporter n=1 Tax=Fulvivirga sedimenti TaxID=2879465 RepID=A0A9X1KXJ7_9BACT|nr:sodium/solute symporter [Fulvivirga sedimenti]MCA6074252.1 sodium/solute symporter [Fulvivirga sedimenti]
MITFSTIDMLIFGGYIAIIIFMGIWVSREKKGHVKDSADYFLASKSLPWWAIGASLIASNISAEQFVGMQGSGFAMGLAISTYEWMAAATLIVVGIFFLPVFLEKQIYTMPQFLEKRFDARVRTSLAVFWLLLYIFVNLSSVLYLGALNLETILGIPFSAGMIGLAVFALLYSLYGGLKAVAWTDVIQVVFLVIGGLMTTYLAVELVGSGNFWSGLGDLRKEAVNHFTMIFDKGEYMIPDGKGGFDDAYTNLPGLGVLLGGMWIANIGYWGFNQYITQRALAAKNINEARNGLLFAGFLKILMPMIVVIPGIAMFVLVTREGGSGEFTAAMTDGTTNLVKSDKAYPVLLNILPAGIKGLSFAALTAAIVSSLASMINSTSTIFTMDIYRNYMNKTASETNLVTTGRIVGVIALILGMIIAPQLSSFDQVFQFIQDFSGYVTPAVVAIFLMGIFWKRTTANAALAVAVVAIPLSWAFGNIEGLPFLDRMGIVFTILLFLMMGVSVLDKNYDASKAVQINREWLRWGMIVLIICTVTVPIYHGMDLIIESSMIQGIVTLVIVGALVLSLIRFKNFGGEDIVQYEKMDDKWFKMSGTFVVGSILLAGIIAALYAVFW